MLLANETVAQHLDEQDVPTLYRIHEEPDPLKVARVRGVRHDARLQPRRAARGGEAAALPEAGRADARHAGREADRVPDAADDAEGALRRDRISDTSASRRAATPISPRRSAAIRTWSSIARCASRGTAHDRGPERGADRRSAGDRAAHVGARAPRRRRRARAGAVEEGPLHGGQGRRRVRRLRHRRDRVRAVHRAGRALRRGAWSTSRRWPTTTTGSSSGRTCCAARTPASVYRLGDRVSVQVVKVDMERRQIDLGLAEILDRVRASERQPRPRAPQQGASRKGGRKRRRRKRGRAAAKGSRRRAKRPRPKERAAKRPIR